MLPDPMSLAWPRTAGSCLLRPIHEDDVDAMLAYRSRPEVVRYLTHDVLDREAVLRRISALTGPAVEGAETLTRGLAVELDGRMIGDGMMRVEAGAGGIHGAGPSAWIGYAFHPDAWGRGHATAVATALVQAAHELGLPAFAQVRPKNAASARVLERAGLSYVRTDTDTGGSVDVYALPSAADGPS